ncbi:MAG: conjugal transfer protein TraN [Sulfolobales archaeon]
MWKVVALLLFVSGLSFSQAINCFDSTPKCVVKDVSEGATSCSDYVQDCQNVNGVYWCPIDLQDKLCTDFDKVGGQNVNGFIVSSNFVSKNEMTYSDYQNILSSLGVSCMPAQTAQSLSLDNVWVCEGYLQGGQVKPAPQGGIPLDEGSITVSGQTSTMSYGTFQGKGNKLCHIESGCRFHAVPNGNQLIFYDGPGASTGSITFSYNPGTTCPSGTMPNPQGYCELKLKGAVVSSDENRCNHPCMTQDTVSSFIQSEPAQDTPQQVSSSDTSLQECTNPVFFAGFRKDCRAGGLTVLGASCCGISGWFSDMCSNSEKELKKRREAGTCKEIGTYCSKKVLGVCIEKKRSFCCFNSQLARILQESCFRPQLGRGWGSPKNPDCGGIALSDFQRVDLGNPDCVRAIEDWISQRAQSFQERLNNMNPTQKSLEAVQTWFQKVSK